MNDSCFSFDRNVPAACQSMQESKWDRKVYSGGCELNGKTLAVIGLGRIGKEVAFRMKSFGMQVTVYSIQNENVG